MNKKAALGIKIGLVVLNAILVYVLYDSINKPIRFKEIRSERHEVVKKRLMEVRELQVAFKNETGEYADDFDQLFAFSDTGFVKIEERKDSSFMYFDDVYQTELERDTIIVRVIDEVPVVKHLFGDNYDVEKLRFVPFTNRQVEFEMQSSFVYRAESRMPTVEIVAYDIDILHDLDGEYSIFFDYDFRLQIGNIAEPNISGNW